jgi:methyl-accepting chemotaxis protein
MTVKHDLALQDRIAFLNITEQELSDLKEGWELIADDFPKIFDHFYDRVGELTKNQHVLQLIKDNDRLKHKQVDHWQKLFCDPLSKDYIDRVHYSGIAHRQVGINPADVVNGYAFIVDEIIDVLQRKLADDAARALQILRSIQKLVAIDIGTAIAVYDALLIE